MVTFASGKQLEKMKIDIEERVQRAREYFRSGYNCAQSVVLAYCDVFGLDPAFAAKLTSAFGGGMGRMREVCGTVSGMAFLTGLISPADNPSDMEARKRNYALIQELAGEFRQRNGSIVCRELLGLGRTQESPMPSERTAEYYRKRPCAEYVADAARIVGEYLNENK